MPAAKAWDQQFQQGQFSSAVLAEAIQLLHSRKQYDQAVECLMSSLRNNHAQPWTYDVLAIQMKLAGRPAAELDRVLQSRVDFTAGDMRQVLITAAMLSRFDAHQEAFDMCRGAALAAPQIPEIWLLARSIADKLDGIEERVWVRCGVLRHVWSGNYEREHAEARQVLQSLLQKLERESDTAAVSAVREQFQQANAIDLRIVLRWVGTADLDLLVEEPSGSVCSFRHPITVAGGRLVREDGGSVDQSGNRAEEYVCPVAANGSYTATVRFVLGKVVAGTAVLEVTTNQNTPRETRERRVISLSRQDVRIPIVLDHGRGDAVGQ